MVTVANEQVSIVTVCQMLGLELPDDIGEGRSRKVPCPFGEMYHSDFGASPAMRIYPDTNSAYCFSCAVYYTPVSLAARAMDTTAASAAAQLLDRIGYTPDEMASIWQQARDYTPEPDKALMADALKTYCRRITPDWTRRQFEPVVASTLTRCLAILDLVRTDEDVTLWLTRCKHAMERVIKGRDPSLSEKYDVLLRSMNEGGHA
jgi:hypothetical protein